MSSGKITFEQFVSRQLDELRSDQISLGDVVRDARADLSVHDENQLRTIVRGTLQAIFEHGAGVIDAKKMKEPRNGLWVTYFEPVGSSPSERADWTMDWWDALGADPDPVGSPWFKLPTSEEAPLVWGVTILVDLEARVGFFERLRHFGDASGFKARVYERGVTFERSDVVAEGLFLGSDRFDLMLRQRPGERVNADDLAAIVAGLRQSLAGIPGVTVFRADDASEDND